MNKYESVCIIEPNNDNAQISNILVKIQNKIAEFSDQPINIENLGKKKLAYKIRKFTEGIYLIINFQCEAQYVAELERYYRITDEIMKFIVVREEN